MAEEVGVLTGESTSHTGCFVFQTARKTKPIKARQPLNMKSLHRVRAVVSDEQDQKHKNHSDLTVENLLGVFRTEHQDQKAIEAFAVQKHGCH